MVFVSTLGEKNLLHWIGHFSGFYCFLGAKAPLQPTSSEGLYVCMSVCLYVCMYVTH